MQNRLPAADLEALVVWSRENLMSLNLSKYKKCPLCRSFSIRTACNIYGPIVQDVSYFINVDVVFDRKMPFDLFSQIYSGFHQRLVSCI